MAILFPRRYKAIGLVYVCDGGALGDVTLPEAFTDRGPPPEPWPLTREILAELARIVSSIGKALDSPEEGE